MESTLSDWAPMPAPSTAPPRLRAIDLLRGVVIVLMALDHVRYFLSEARFDPTDPGRTTAALFATRWITHLCAPVFMLLAGTGARLALGRGRDRRSLSMFLVTRGLWLVLLELTVARAAWQFNLDYGYSAALVLWALGWCMVALAALVWLPDRWIVLVGAAMVLLHNALDPFTAADFGRLGWLWTVLHEPGSIALGPDVELFVLYPLVPWIGVMALGYVLGPVFERAAAERDRMLVRMGAALCAGFVVLRLLNLYGDPVAWTPQPTGVRTVFSFLNATKYPASLSYVLMTLGPALLALPLLDRLHGALPDAVRTFGQVPLFFWLLHVPLIHLTAVVLSLADYGTVVPWLVRNPPAEPPPGYGYSLGVVYAVTLAVVAALYPACRRFAALKKQHPGGWLSYL
jgi:uncharacterized membrane protein